MRTLRCVIFRGRAFRVFVKPRKAARGGDAVHVVAIPADIGRVGAVMKQRRILAQFRIIAKQRVPFIGVLVFECRLFSGVVVAEGGIVSLYL